jgi:serine/threonine protein phosphatase PrpC
VLYAGVSETGTEREHNEDSWHADGRIFIVADGMGGHRAGEVASSAAIEEFMRFERENRGVEPLDRIRDGILAANRRLYEMSLRDSALEGMGTTFTIALYEEEVFLGHVGDTRAYLLRDGELSMLTRDHSLVEQMVSEGYISRREARVHPQRNVILRALGVSEDLEIDLDSLAPTAGDRIILCSDGLSGVLEDREIAYIASSERDPEAACRRLVRSSKERGATDDVTAVLLEIDRSPAGQRDGEKGKKAWWRSILPRGSS